MQHCRHLTVWPRLLVTPNGLLEHPGHLTSQIPAGELCRQIGRERVKSLVLDQKMGTSVCVQSSNRCLRIELFINCVSTRPIETLWQQPILEMLLSLLPASQLPCLLHSRAKAQNALLHCRKKADFQSRYAETRTVSVHISSPLIHRHLLEAGNF